MFAIMFSGLLSSTSTAHSLDAFAMLRDICKYESRGSRDPEDEISQKGAVGYCQIRVSTARWLGYRGKNWKLLRNRDLNLFWANKVLNRCLARWHNTPYRIAFCYHAGERAKVPKLKSDREKLKSHIYAVAVSARYWESMDRRKKRMKKKGFKIGLNPVGWPEFTVFF